MSKRIKRATALALAGLVWVSAPRAAEAPAASPVPMITEPNWLRRPDGKDLAASFPVLNRANQNGGSARISCLVTIQGTLERCKVLEERPAGSGFGGSALLLAPAFRMKPLLVDGKPMGGAEVRIPFNFGARQGAAPGPTARVLTFAPWATTPTPEQVAAVYPSAAADLDRGHVGLRCRIVRDGRLKECVMVDQGASGKGFEAAARKLIPLFQVAMDENAGKLPDNIYVNLPIDLPNPRKPQPPAVIMQPNWMSMPQPEDVLAAFPEKARQARITSGEVLLNCAADHAGLLAGCTVANEKPAAMGFGEAAIAITRKMKINPWTASGSPSDGSLIRIPLRIDDAVAPAAAAKP